MASPRAIDIRTIEIDEKPRPAILASLLGVTEPMVYKFREKGALPANLNASYVDCINHHINYLKQKAAGKAGSLGELVQMETAKKLLAQREEIILGMRIKRNEFADYSELKELFEPIFRFIQSSLLNLSRKHPETIDYVDSMLEMWHILGKQIAEKAKLDGDTYIKAMMEREFSTEELENEILSSFGLDLSESEEE